MESESTLFLRNIFTDEWESRVKRYRDSEKLLFALGEFDVRLTRLDEGHSATSMTDIHSNSLLRS